MLKLAANLSLMFTDVPFLDRFASAAEAGFRGVEFMFPYDHAPDEVAARARAAGVEVALFNLPAGDWAGGERGIGALPERVGELREGLERALAYAQALRCPRLHLMAGKAPADDRHRRTLIDNLVYAADRLAREGIDILIEPISTRVDIPGYFLSSTDAAASIIRDVARPNAKLQYDIYHMQIMEGDLARRIADLLPLIGHMQLADNPGRAEPGSGEINYPWLLSHIDALGYAGWIGCEYRPASDTRAGLSWAAPYL